MSRPVTLATLQNRVLQRANLQYASNSAIAPLAEVTDNVNEGIAELYDLIAQVQGHDFYLNSVTFVTTPNVDTYAIGTGQAIPVADFYRLRGLDITYGQNIIVSAKPFMWGERNRFKWYTGWIYTQPVFYRLTGNALKLIPTPNGGYTCTLWYTPVAPSLVNAGDTFDGIDGHEEYAVLSAAIKLLTKQEQFEHAQVLATERERSKDRVLGMLAARDAESPERVQDVMSGDDVFGMYPGT